MKKTLSISLFLILVALLSLLFLKSNFLKDTIQKKIDERLSSLPYDIECELKGLSLFPPEILFSSINAGKHGVSLLGLNNCRLRGLLGFSMGRAPKLSMECESGDLFSENLPKDYELGGRSLKNSPRNASIEKTFLRLSVDRLGLIYKDEAQVFGLKGKYDNNKFQLCLERPGQGKTRPFLKIRGNLAEKEADLIFRHIDLENLIGSLLPLEKDLPKGKAGGRAKLSLDENGIISVTADFNVKGLIIYDRFINTKPLSLPLSRIKAHAKIDVKEKSLTLTGASISLKGIILKVRGVASKDQFKVNFSTERLAINDLARLFDDPLFDDFLMKGFLQVDLSLEGDLTKKGRITKPELKGIIEDVKQLSTRLRYLRRDFAHQFKDNRGNHVTITVGQGNPDYVYLNAMPDYVYRSVVLAEDAGFFGHKGIDLREIEAAMKDYVETNRVRGGSTITQQLAKNLFLRKDKTIVRKLKEILLAIELDASLSKSRILEIYLNIIEWGPGIRGIGHAARHYFGKPASMLTPLEAAYLASIIPNPKRFYVHYRRGVVNPNWRERVNQILSLMNEHGYIGYEQFRRALSEHVVFSEARS